MSNYAWVVLGVGVVALAVGLVIIFRQDSDASEPEPAPGSWAGTVEAAEWDERAATARADFGLGMVRDVASKWTGSIAALLGILSSVAFVAGPSDLVKDVGGWEAQLAAWLVLAAAGLAAAGLAFAIVAEQGTPSWTSNLDGWTYRWRTLTRAKKSAREIAFSRYLILGALILMIIATGIAWMTALTKPASGQDAIVAFSGGAQCGVLATHDGVLTITVGGSTRTIAPNAEITLVGNCP